MSTSKNYQILTYNANGENTTDSLNLSNLSTDIIDCAEQQIEVIVDNQIQKNSSGLKHWQEDNNTSNSILNVVGEGDNIDAIINPKGKGSFLNSTTGNTRGINAVDLQMSRDSDDEVASGNYSNIIGGQSNKAEGLYSIVSGGSNNIVLGLLSAVSSGFKNKIFGPYSTISGGTFNTINGWESVVSGGRGNIIDGSYSIVAGRGLIATNNHSAAFGKYNKPGERDTQSSSAYQFMIGNGYNNSNRENIFAVQRNGVTRSKGGIFTFMADIAEWMESSLTTKIPKGTSVVVINGKIVPALDDDQPIGVISTNPSFIGNDADDHWHDKYVYNNGGVVYEEYTFEEQVPLTKPVTKTITMQHDKLVNGKTIIVEKKVSKTVEELITENIEVYNEQGKLLRTISRPVMTTVTKTDQRMKINPKYNPDLEYIPRSQRPEWNLVGLLGQVPVLKGQPINDNWRWLYEIDCDFDMYLIK